VLPAPSTAIGSGALGKWKYVQQLDAFVGLADSYDGNVWLYKPVGWINPVTGGEGTPSPPSILTNTLIDAVAGSYYSTTLGAIGGVAPYVWALVDGTLPSGMVLDPSGQLSGVSLEAGSYLFTVEVVDGNGVAALRELTLRVKDASAVFFEDDFSHGTLGPWAQLRSGTIRLVSDPIDGWVLRKSGADDPSGGWASLGAALGDFELVLYTRKVNTVGGSWNRYSVTDSAGNGYGIYLSYDTGQLGLERRDAWSSVVKRAASGSLPGGMQLGQWYTLRLSRQGSTLAAEVFNGDVDPVVSKPLLQVTMVDATHKGLTHLSINGGRDFDTAYVRVSEQVMAPALAVTTEVLTDATSGLAYSQVLDATGGVSPYNWNVVGGGLPDGVLLDPSGQLLGTASMAGNYTFTVQVMGQNGMTAIREFNLLVKQAARVLFEDDFSDATLQPWSQLGSAQINLINAPAAGWVLRKSGADDPNGGSALLAAMASDFELVVHTRKVNTVGGSWNRYSITDSAGNGYGVYLAYDSGQVGVERRDRWTAAVKRASAGSLPGGLKLGDWYTLRLIRQGSNLTAEVFEGRITPAAANPALQVTMVDASHGGATQININGGRDFDTARVTLLVP
jgi:hypothetical protein